MRLVKAYTLCKNMPFCIKIIFLRFYFCSYLCIKGIIIRRRSKRRQIMSSLHRKCYHLPDSIVWPNKMYWFALSFQNIEISSQSYCKYRVSKVHFKVASKKFGPTHNTSSNLYCVVTIILRCLCMCNLSGTILIHFLFQCFRYLLLFIRYPLHG